ncbi:MAG: hypothetical protein EOP24_23185 [Hyphomicrobiales bacterium]|nr:MAG: hypothetical protein EOP24_23185 [Hyphomicrobiales bacterium]
MCNLRHSVRAGILIDVTGLTFRQQQVLQLVVAGSSNKRTAAEFELSPRTVEAHQRHIRRAGRRL